MNICAIALKRKQGKLPLNISQLWEYGKPNNIWLRQNIIQFPILLSCVGFRIHTTFQGVLKNIPEYHHIIIENQNNSIQYQEGGEQYAIKLPIFCQIVCRGV